MKLVIVAVSLSANGASADGDAGPAQSPVAPPSNPLPVAPDPSSAATPAPPANPPPADPALRSDPAGTPLPPASPALPIGNLPNLTFVPAYPEAVVDRPLVLLSGMTALDAVIRLESTVSKSLGDRAYDVAIAHAFGPVEITAELGKYAAVHVALATHSFADLVDVYGLAGATQPDGSLHVAQGARAAHKLHLIPGLLALRAELGVTVSENRYRDYMNALVSSQVVGGFADAALEVQLTPGFVVIGGLSGSTPLASFNGTYSSTVSAGGGLILTLTETWDVYAHTGVIDLANTHLPYVEAGFEERWGP